MIDSSDCYMEDQATCPYCGYKEKDSWEISQSGEFTCNNCDKTYWVEVQTDVRYSTKPITSAEG